MPCAAYVCTYSPAGEISGEQRVGFVGRGEKDWGGDVAEVVADGRIGLHTGQPASVETLVSQKVSSQPLHY